MKVSVNVYHLCKHLLEKFILTYAYSLFQRTYLTLLLHFHSVFIFKNANTEILEN